MFNSIGPGLRQSNMYFFLIQGTDAEQFLKKQGRGGRVTAAATVVAQIKVS